MEQNKEFVLKSAYNNNVKFIRLWFTDILGFLKSFAITITELEDALDEGVRFDGSTLEGFPREREQEMIALPDASTFQILPWRPKEDSVARMFCDIYRTDMTHYEGDSRYILKKNLLAAGKKGFTFYTGPEIEFFFFKNSTTPDILDSGSYFDLTPLDLASDYRRQTVLSLEEMGVEVISSHHEGAFSQHEIDLRHRDALTIADNIMTFKLVAKEIGQQNGIYASFMPKPLEEHNGSGMHIHQSLFHDEENIFFDKKMPYHLSQKGKHYIAGLLKHCREYFTITNQWINSYKRLQFGFESPTHISWSTESQTSLVRIPGSKPDKPNAMRVEIRNPDPACNPYLAFSVMLASGLKGIEKEYELQEPIGNESIIRSREELISRNLEPLPSQLSETIPDFAESKLMKETLGEYVVKKIVDNKLYEIEQYNRHITGYEISKYLPIL